MTQHQHSPALGHHFDDLEQQHHANTMGMWIFLATEVMFFGAMFLGYTVYRILYPGVFDEASRHLNVLFGTVNTAILLTSSLCMALAVWAAGLRRRTLVALFLMVTLVLGLAFLGIKGFEWYQEYQENLVPLPGFEFVWEGANPERARLFFSLYFVLTGFHALHLIIGVGLIAIFAVAVWRGQFEHGTYTPVELLGLYWHFVDVVWVFLFPLLYLIDRT